MNKENDNFYKKDYWIRENLAFSQPYFRLEKCAKLINAIAKGRNCDLLDLGCGPGTLGKLLCKNINYFGIDIAVQNPGPNSLEMDALENKIEFIDKTFDIIVASGFFEYMGHAVRQKLSEIHEILNSHGKFVVTHTNINHPDLKLDNLPWNNFQSIESFNKDLELYFHIDKFLVSSYNRRFYPSTKRLFRYIQMNISTYIPFIGPRLALDYILICSKKGL